MAGCSCAKRTDEYHGWECEVSGGACMFLFPDSKACAEKYGEGPDAYIEDNIDDPQEGLPEDDDIIHDEEWDYESEEDELDNIIND